jgi:hypothetical protein
MKLWIISFVVLFATAELLRWAQEFSLPMPIFILGGAFLAVMSNYDKLADLPFHPNYYPSTTLADPPKQPLPTEEPRSLIADTPPSIVVTDYQRKKTSISFTIHKPFEPKD